MSKYIQELAHKVHVPLHRINRVLAMCIEHDIPEFTVADDRGGSDTWVVRFGPDVPKKAIRAVVGAGLEIERE